MIALNDEQMQQVLQSQARMEEQIKTLFKQQEEIKSLTETVQRLAIAIERQGTALQSTEKKVDGVRIEVDEIKSKPGKRWETIIAAVITGIVGFLLARFGI